MSQSPDIFLHAGAHRTGTSSFQLCLDANADALRGAGYSVAYPGRDGIPGGKLRLKLPHPRHGAKQIDSFLEPLRPYLAGLVDNRKALILSEENVPGRMLHFQQGQFFPARAKRARVLAAALPGRIAHLVYVVRPYDQLFVSAYRIRAQDMAVAPFDTVRPNLLKVEEGWPELMTCFLKHLKPKKLTVLTYAARGDSPSLLQRLVPELPFNPVDGPHSLNVSPTDAALIELQRRHQAGEALTRQAVLDINASHAEDKRDLGVTQFSSQEKAQLTDRYERDLDRLAEMDGVTLVSA